MAMKKYGVGSPLHAEMEVARAAVLTLHAEMEAARAAVLIAGSPLHAEMEAARAAVLIAQTGFRSGLVLR
ncbi:hypothetical protein ACFX1Z_044189 [Malus domestica]